MYFDLLVLYKYVFVNIGSRLGAYSVLLSYCVGRAMCWSGVSAQCEKGFDILNTIILCLVNTIVLWYVFSQFSIILDVVGEDKVIHRKL